MKKILVIGILLLGSLTTYSNGLEKEEKARLMEENKTKEAENDFYRFKLSTSLITRHGNDDDIYDNNSQLIALEYFLKEDLAVAAGTFNNSFSKRSYVVTANKYFYPFKTKKIGLGLGVGIVKGYYDRMEIKDDNGEVIKSSRFKTNLFDDYMFGGAVSVEYRITERISVSAMYVGAYMATVSVRF